jgi:hypothetical protein
MIGGGGEAEKLAPDKNRTGACFRCPNRSYLVERVAWTSEMLRCWNQERRNKHLSLHVKDIWSLDAAATRCHVNSIPQGWEALNLRATPHLRWLGIAPGIAIRTCKVNTK